MRIFRAVLLGAALLLSSGLAATPPAVPGTVTTSFGRLPIMNGRDVQVALRAPGFAGVWVEGDSIVIAATTADAVKRAAIVRALRDVWGAGLEGQGGGRLEAARFVMVKYDALQLAQVRALAGEVRGWQGIGTDVKNNRVKIELTLPEHRAPAEAFFRARGIPLDAVFLNAPASPELPAKTTRREPLRAWLTAPAQVAQNDLLTFGMQVQNLGRTALELNIVCAFDYRIVRADTGAVVRPVPAPGACPSLGAWVTIPPGQTREALVSPWENTPPLAWDLRDTQGRPVPPGRYLLQLAHGQGDQAIRPADLPFTVLPAAKDGGVGEVVRRLWGYGLLEEPEREAALVVRAGVQRVQFMVPDERARAGMVALARQRGVGLARVDFVVRPAPPLPPAGDGGQATLKVMPSVSARADSHTFDLRIAPGAAQAVLPGARGCELIFVLRRVSTGGVIFASRQTTFAPHFLPDGMQKCPTGATLDQRGQWRGRLSDGSRAPAGEYEVRAGLRVTGQGGAVRWLAAAPERITLR